MYILWLFPLFSFVIRWRCPFIRNQLYILIISAKEVMSSSAFVCLFVIRIAQKLLDRFSQNLVKMWHMGHGRNH